MAFKRSPVRSRLPPPLKSRLPAMEAFSFSSFGDRIGDMSIKIAANSYNFLQSPGYFAGAFFVSFASFACCLQVAKIFVIVLAVSLSADFNKWAYMFIVMLVLLCPILPERVLMSVPDTIRKVPAMCRNAWG